MFVRDPGTKKKTVFCIMDREGNGKTPIRFFFCSLCSAMEVCLYFISCRCNKQKSTQSKGVTVVIKAFVLTGRLPPNPLLSWQLKNSGLPITSSLGDNDHQDKKVCVGGGGEWGAFLDSVKKKKNDFYIFFKKRFVLTNTLRAPAHWSLKGAQRSHFYRLLSSYFSA